MVKGEGKCPFIQNIYKDDIYKLYTPSDMIDKTYHINDRAIAPLTPTSEPNLGGTMYFSMD